MYSTKLDGPCAINLPVQSQYDKGILVNKPFNNWVKITTLSNHFMLVYYHDCVQAADTLKDAFTDPSTSRIDAGYMLSGLHSYGTAQV